MAPGGPAFLTPVSREAVAHQHRLDARIAQHGMAGRFAAVKIGEVVGLEYRSATVDVCVVAVDVVAGDQEDAGFVLWRIGNRRAYCGWIDPRLTQRPGQQG